MKTKNIFLLVCGIVMIPYIGHAATCSRANLTRCLDSACAINVGSNPAARCQYCGTDSAGTPPTMTGVRGVMAGQSTKYTLTEKELKKAPTEPGSRYAWATAQCVAKVSGCTLDDVTDTYDSLIEQSCKAAGIDAHLATIRAEIAKKPTKVSCTTNIRSCMVAAPRCNFDYRACEDNAEFDKFFSECSVAATGCDSYMSAIKKDLIAARDTSIANASAVVEGLITGYRNSREVRLNSIRNGCKNNALRDACVESVCANNMRNHCDSNWPQEKSMAIQLCKFYEIACNTVK